MEQIAKGYTEGERIAKLSVWTLVAIGVFEISIGFLTNSLGLSADGFDSLSDAVISFIVWFGLRFSRRKPGRYFHYGYYKVESLAALLASIGMIAIASLILYNAYNSFFQRHQLSYPILALSALAIAGTISLYRAFQMRRIAAKYELLSLKIDASNSIKDGTASFLVLGSVSLASVGFPWMDSVGAIIVSIYIYTVAYVAVKEASLILLDSFNSPEVLEQVQKVVKTIPEVSDVLEVKLRQAGPYITGRVLITVNRNMTVGEADYVVRQVKSVLTQNMDSLRDLVVLAAPTQDTKDRKEA